MAPIAHRPHRVAIIGGGASGVLTAINLLTRTGDVEVTIHETTGVVGRGIAYGTNDRRHLLNVRARHMSAFPDSPSDLLDWAFRAGHSCDPQGFFPRADYATYLQDRLMGIADDRLEIRAGRVIDLERSGSGFTVTTERTRAAADSVVLCVGNQAPRPLAVDGTPLPAAPWHQANPWDLGRLRGLAPAAHALVVGTGLTAVDTVITLLEEGPGRHVTMISRSGGLPHPHIEQQHTGWVTRIPGGPLTADLLAAALTEQCAAASRRGVDWRNVVDGLRPVTQDAWQRLPLGERRRFLTTYRREWEVRRHRMAPEVALRLERYRLEGRLTIRTGSLSGVTDLGAQAAVSTGVGAAPIQVDAVVNCTGPLTDLALTTDPLLRSLAARGLVAPDPLALGLDTTPDGRLIGSDARPVDGFFTVGPARKGTLWESTAIPEIRTQAAQVAAAIGQRAGALPLVADRAG